MGQHVEISGSSLVRIEVWEEISNLELEVALQGDIAKTGTELREISPVVLMIEVIR